MIINFKELFTRPNGLRTYRTQLDLLSIVKENPDIQQIGPVSVDVTASYASNYFEVKGQLSVEITLKCSRCLKSFTKQLDIPFRELFAEQGSELSSEESEDVHILEGFEVDIEPYIQQTILLAVPYIPVCEEDCKGLCPVCGNNRNEVDCECKQDKLDPRLAALADFFKNEQ